MLKKVISNSKRGFTLIEIIVVVGIIAVLVGLAITAGGLAKAGARDNQRKTDISLLQVKLEAYRGQYGIYPTSLNVATTPPSLVSSGFISVLPLDPSTKVSYIYIPLQFSADTCGVSYYLYATLENKNSVKPAVVNSSLVPCYVAWSTIATTSYTYDVTSPI